MESLKEKSCICVDRVLVMPKAEECAGGVGGENDQFREKVEGLHERFSEYGRNVKEWAKRCMLLLPEIDKYKVWARKGFSDVYEYAAKVAGLNTEQVMEGLRVLKKVEGMPALKEVIEKKGINAVRPVATIATLETSQFWAEKARNMSVNELRTYVRDFRRQGGVGVVVVGGVMVGVAGDGTVGGTCEANGVMVGGAGGTGGGEVGGTVGGSSELPLFGGDGANTVATFSGDFGKQANRSGSRNVPTLMELEPAVLDQLKKLKGDGDWNELMKKFLEMRTKELEREKPEPVKTESRHIPAEIERYVIERDCGRCAFPGCDRSYEELHHTQGFARENVHDPDRIFCLCEAHHQLAHRGLIENEELPAKWWRVRGEADRASFRFGLDQIVVGYRRVGAG